MYVQLLYMCCLIVTLFNTVAALQRAKTFLPFLLEANKKLEARIESEGGDSCNIECVDDDDRVIEMVRNPSTYPLLHCKTTL